MTAINLYGINYIERSIYIERIKQTEKKMPTDLENIRRNFIQGLGEISRFWGFSPVMGQIYGLMYLATEPTTAETIMQKLGASKGNVSINLRNLDRWGMVRKIRKPGDRKEYYEVETDFVRIFINMLTERKNRDFDRSLRTVTNCLEELKGAEKSKETIFVRGRLLHMEKFFKMLDVSVSTFLKVVGKKR